MLNLGQCAMVMLLNVKEGRMVSLCHFGDGYYLTLPDEFESCLNLSAVEGWWFQCPRSSEQDCTPPHF